MSYPTSIRGLTPKRYPLTLVVYPLLLASTFRGNPLRLAVLPVITTTCWPCRAITPRLMLMRNPSVLVHAPYPPPLPTPQTYWVLARAAIFAQLFGRILYHFVPVGTCPLKKFFAPAWREGHSGGTPLIPVGEPKLARYLVPKQQKTTTPPGKFFNFDDNTDIPFNPAHPTCLT